MRPPIPPFDIASATLKVRAAEDAWNRRDPAKVALAYTPDSRWRNRSEFITGRAEIEAFLTRKWAKEQEYRLIKELWAVTGDRMALTAKLNMDDGVKGGLWLEESVPMAKVLEADGLLDAIQLTGGSSLLNGMYFFRGHVPLDEFAATQPKVVGLGLKVMGHKIFPEYPFEEGFFLPLARQFRAEMSMPLVLLGGINEMDTIEGALGEGFELVAMARALLREPDLPNRFRDAGRRSSLCVHCNLCLPTIYTGTRCVLVPEQ